MSEGVERRQAEFEEVSQLREDGYLTIKVTELNLGSADLEYVLVGLRKHGNNDPAGALLADPFGRLLVFHGAAANESFAPHPASGPAGPGAGGEAVKQVTSALKSTPTQ